MAVNTEGDLGLRLFYIPLHIHIIVTGIIDDLHGLIQPGIDIFGGLQGLRILASQGLVQRLHQGDTEYLVGRGIGPSELIVGITGHIDVAINEGHLDIAVGLTARRK